LTPSEALSEIRASALANRIVLSSHARQRMQERQVSYGHVRHALANAFACAWQPVQGTWRVAGNDLLDEPLTVVVILEDGLVVVTVF
jgi:hypothetical protein